MSASIFFLVLAAALLHAVWNALVKSRGDQLLTLAGVIMVGVVGGFFVMLAVAPPARESWLYIFLSALCHCGYYVFLLNAYRIGDLSFVYPLARGSAPMLVALAALAFAGERLTAWMSIGIVLTCTGIASLAFERGPPWRHDLRPLLFALGTSLFIAGYTVIDGIGVRLSASPLGYIAWLFFVSGWSLGLYAWWRRGPRRIRAFLRSEWKVCLGGGIASTLAYGLVIYAMAFGTMASVSALRETGVIFAALIGMVALREGFRPPRLYAASIVALGVAVTHLPG